MNTELCSLIKPPTPSPGLDGIQVFGLSVRKMQNAEGSVKELHVSLMQCSENAATRRDFPAFKTLVPKAEMQA